jgi:hypothetical protein
LGDGVYCDNDGYQIILTAEDGIRATNTIYLEPAVFNALVDYVQHLGGCAEGGAPANSDAEPDNA